jgi:hypothetical protein
MAVQVVVLLKLQVELLLEQEYQDKEIMVVQVVVLMVLQEVAVELQQ